MNVQEFEQLAHYTVGNARISAEARADANAKLANLSSNISFISTLENVFEQSTESYAIVAAARCLLNLITDHRNAFSIPQRVDIRKYFSIIYTELFKVQVYNVP